MSVNRDEALRAKALAEGLMKKADFTAARKLAMRAYNMDSSLENISHMRMVCDVHCAATEKVFGNEMDWYGILQVDVNANDLIIKKQYRRLALLLHPDKNKLPGAESAFKLIGEAQRILLDREKRTLHNTKRKNWRRPAPAPSYKPQQVPSYRTQQATVNMRNVFNELRPENRYPQQKAQAQSAAFTRRTFWTSCPFCRCNYEYGREHIKREITCQACKKQFTAFEIPFQSVPPAKSSCQTTSSFPQQNKFPGLKAYNEPHKRSDGPATVPSGKASFPMSASTAENNNRRRKRKNMDESSENSDSDSSSDSEDVVNDRMAARDMGSNGGQQPRRSVRSKRQVSYNENMSDDDGDLVNDKGEGSGKNVDSEKEEEPEDEKQTHENHHPTETLPNGINPEEKIKGDQAESLDDSEDDSCLGNEAEPNLINCDDPEFSDFDKLREKSRFKVGQIWALYDEEEGMPRFYAVIKKVTTPDFSVKYKWLEAEEDETRKLPVSVGRYELGVEEKTNSCALFSHLVCDKTRSNARYFKVLPGEGETWALFKNWNMDLSSDSNSTREYEFVEIASEHAEGTAMLVRFLSKVKGFKYVFCPMPKDGAATCEVPPHEFRRFSHRVPSFRLKGTEGRGVSEGWFELDPAALPVPGSQNISGEEGAAQDQDHQSPPSGSAC